MTGYISFLGRTEHDTIELVEKTVNEQGGVNGQSVRFIYHDDETKPQNAVELASQILASHPAVMFEKTLAASGRKMEAPAELGWEGHCFS